jgi:crossover junction endodeoxyribonuclease RuvC
VVTVGVDIGVGGGVAVAWWEEGAGSLPTRVEAARMPVERAGAKGRRGSSAAGLVAWLMPRVLPAMVSGGNGGVMAAYERVHAMPGQGTVSMFSFGRSAGVVEGVLVAMGLSTWAVEPARWKRDMEMGRDKAVVRAKAAKLLPAWGHLWPGGKDDGIAEAVLLACWLRWHGTGRKVAV